MKDWWGAVKKTQKTSLNVGELFSDQKFYEIIEFFSWNIACGKKDTTTSLNVGEQFLDEGFYENNCFFFMDCRLW